MSGLSRFWAAHGHSVQVVTGMPNHPDGVVREDWRGLWKSREQDQGVEILRNWLLAMPNKSMAQRLIGQGSYAVSASTLGRVRSAKADVVIATSPSIFTGWAGLTHRIGSKVPIVLEVRDLWPQLFIEMGMITNPVAIALASRMEKKLYTSADLIVTVTNRFKDIIVGRGIPEDRVVVIHNGFDPDHFAEVPGERDEVRARWGLQDKYVVSYVGTHGLLHRLDFLLDVAERLKDDPRFQIFFVGDGAERAKLVAEAESRGLGNVTFAGLLPYSEIRGIYAASDLCYVPLRPHPFLFENFVPSKIFEILGAGRPILGAVGGEAAEVIEESGLGRVVQPGDVDAITAAVRDMADHPYDEAARQKARDSVSRFRRNDLATRYMDHLQELVEETSR
ncbi:MAG: glycosyltransferase family 4 protein [Proteobacteria bacterium]|nr:glycosyltransferase family 4 protein [Pseudomonadota bacterium]